MEDNTKLYWQDVENLGFTKGQLSLISDYQKLKGFKSVTDLVKFALLEVAQNKVSSSVYGDVITLLRLALRYPEQADLLITLALEVLKA